MHISQVAAPDFDAVSVEGLDRITQFQYEDSAHNLWRTFRPEIARCKERLEMSIAKASTREREAASSASGTKPDYSFTDQQDVELGQITPLIIQHGEPPSRDLGEKLVG